MKSLKLSSDLIFLSLLCAFILGIAVAILIKPHKSFSERENRSLQGFPNMSSGSLLSGEFSRQLSSFYSDQLPFRQELGYLYAYTELSMGKRECNGVLIEDEDLFLQVPSKEQTENEILKSNLESARRLEEKESAVFFCVPRSCDVFSDKMPDSLREVAKETLDLADCELARALLDEISQSGAPNEYYYHTDHHWTAKGAYTAYKLLAAELGYEPHDESFFRIETASANFLGTSFSKSALPESSAHCDAIELYRYEQDDDVIVTRSEQKEINTGLYDLSALEGYDKYRVFLGGNYAHLSIKMPSEKGEDRQKLLLIKDSFANSLIPFLALHFDVEVIDPRYASPSQIRALLESESFDKTLVLCSLDTLSTERSYGRAIDIIQ